MKLGQYDQDMRSSRDKSILSVAISGYFFRSKRPKRVPILLDSAYAMFSRSADENLCG